MMVKIITKLLFVFLVLCNPVSTARRLLDPPTCGPDKSGSCIHPQQCNGEKRLSNECKSVTGRRLVCCQDFSYPEKKVDSAGVCGMRPLADLIPRKGDEMRTAAIVGGKQSWSLTWPWMSAIFDKKSFLCGGALVAPDCVVTAGHCFDGSENNPQRFYVRLGEHNLYLDSGNEFPEEHQAKKIFVHPGFVVNSSDNDIAIIRLNTSSELTTVCLPRRNFHDKKFIGYNGVVTGWGTVRYDSQYKEPFSPFLQEIVVPIKPTSFCEEHYHNVPDYFKSFHSGLEEPRFICAGVDDGSKDSCLGDSGGPLVVELEPNQWTLIGVVCIGYGCGLRGYPGIYTRVTQYQDWIEKHCNL